MLASLKAFRMDHLRHIRHAENKQLQLQVARELGLHIPRTLTTNDPAAVRAFAKSCESGMNALLACLFPTQSQTFCSTTATTHTS